MSIQKLIASNSNEGLKRIREDFGDDAMILKTVKRNGKVEFFIEVAEAEYAQIPETQIKDTQFNESDELRQEMSDTQAAAKIESGLKDEYQQARLKMLTSVAEKPAQVEPEVPYNKPLKQRQSIGAELTVKALIEALRLEPSVAAQLRGCKRIDEVLSKLGSMIQFAPQAATGICAFVGPAGAGKTTNLTKLMVKHIMQYGAESCALINCDRFRIGAMEQANRLGELMGVNVQHVDATLSLNQAIANVHKRSLIAIDLPGLSISDERMTAELFKLSSSHYEIKRYFVVPANLGYHSLRRYADYYTTQQGTQAILTHLDEVACMGDVLSFLVRTQLPLSFCSDGSHIPEDIIVANADDITTRSMNLIGDQFAKAAMSDLTNREGLNEMVMDI